MEDVYIALDIGGTKIMAAAINSKREILARDRVDTPHPLAEGLTALKNIVSKVRGSHSIKAIGATAGGPLDYATGTISPLHNPQWKDVPLKQIMQQEFACAFSVDVDTNAAALAEYLFTGNKSDRLLYITISTGMGGGFIIDGKIYRGMKGSHPEVGHHASLYQLPIAGPIACPCGGEGLPGSDYLRNCYPKELWQTCRATYY